MEDFSNCFPFYFDDEITIPDILPDQMNNEVPFQFKFPQIDKNDCEAVVLVDNQEIYEVHHYIDKLNYEALNMQITAQYNNSLKAKNWLDFSMSKNNCKPQDSCLTSSRWLSSPQTSMINEEIDDEKSLDTKAIADSEQNKLFENDDQIYWRSGESQEANTQFESDDSKYFKIDKNSKGKKGGFRRKQSEDDVSSIILFEYQRAISKQLEIENGVIMKSKPGRERKNPYLTSSKIDSAIREFIITKLLGVIGNQKWLNRKDLLVTAYFRVIKKIPKFIVEKCSTKNLYKRNIPSQYIIAFVESSTSFAFASGGINHQRIIEDFIEFIIIYFSEVKWEEIINRIINHSSHKSKINKIISFWYHSYFKIMSKHKF